ncbi:hypothetical protein [Aurantimonas sp. 22II-16-19i]|nr:hypothetical protein [Aurantimonas sp. 22II-16-19i]
MAAMEFIMHTDAALLTNDAAPLALIKKNRHKGGRWNIFCSN